MERFQVKLKLHKVYFLGNPIEVTMQIKNRTKFSYYLLKQSLGMDTLDKDCFQVTHKGREVEYDGFLVKQGETNQLKDYILLHAGKSIKVKICLAKNYVIEEGGYYKIRFNRQLQFMRVDTEDTFSRLMHEEADCKGTGFWVLNFARKACMTVGQMERRMENDRMERMDPQNAPVGNYMEPNIYFYNTYSEEYKVKLIQATRKAHYILAYYLYYSRKELASEEPEIRNANLHYQMVFGDYDESRYQTVQKVYDKVEEAMRRDQITYIYIKDNKNTYAYTTKGTRTIYLCEAYEQAALTGEDSKMGTLLHELTHAAADTDDEECDSGTKCYGRERCRELAESHPDRAVNNADSYEFFLESKFLNRMTELQWPNTKDVAVLEYGGPAVAVNGELVYLFYVDKANRLKFSVYHKDTDAYDEIKEVTDENGAVLEAEGHPTVIFYNGILHLFFIADKKLMMCKYSEAHFTSPVQVVTYSGEEINPVYLSKPALYNGKINFVYRKEEGLGIYHLVGDGEEWETEKEIGGSPVENYFHYNPAVCVYKGKLYLFYQIAQGDVKQQRKIYYAYCKEEGGKWCMNQSVEKEIVQPIEKNKTCFPIGAYSAVCAESYDDFIYLIFCEADSKKTIQLQMSENVFLKNQREWTDLERLERSSTKGLKLKQDISYDIAGNQIFQYMVYLIPGKDGIYISTKMR